MRTVRLTKESTKDILENLLKRSPNNYGKFEAAVADILANVKEKGDEALFSYTKEFDKVEVTPETIRVTEAEIEEACRAAAADGYIKNFPDGYDTELGQGGVNVSGGQKQRLCIARALISKPKIIILDDSTSAVDTATDAAIRKALSEELSSTTTIIIAQRIASVMDADRIVIMNEGKIDDVGTHAELMQRSEIYREVYYSQQKGVEE